MANRGREVLKVLAVALLFMALPKTACADWEDVAAKFTPRISVLEEYSDNLDLTAKNKRSDFITTISPGLAFSSTENKEVKYGLDLDYAPGFVFYAKNSEDNYVSHTGTLNTWYTFGRHLTFRLWDHLIRSEEPQEHYVTIQPTPGAYYLGTQQQRSVYWRNVFQPSLTYQFGREDQVELTYVDNYYTNDNPDTEDSHGKTISSRLGYWFNIRNGVSLEYAYNIGNFDRSEDFTGHHTLGRYTYRFNPVTSVFGQFTYDTLNYDSPGVDYSVYNPSIGITHAFTQNLSGRAQVGYFWRKAEGQKTTDGFSMDVGVTQRTQRTTYDLAFQTGYAYDFFSAENLGFTKYYRAIGNVSHQLGSRLAVVFTGSVERDEYVDVTDRVDWLWRVSGDLSYQALKWLTASVGVRYTDNNSDQDTFDYQEFRAMARLTAFYAK